jgi:hypothetical protein
MPLLTPDNQALFESLKPMWEATILHEVSRQNCLYPWSQEVKNLINVYRNMGCFVAWQLYPVANGQEPKGMAGLNFFVAAWDHALMGTIRVPNFVIGVYVLHTNVACIEEEQFMRFRRDFWNRGRAARQGYWYGRWDLLYRISPSSSPSFSLSSSFSSSPERQSQLNDEISSHQSWAQSSGTNLSTPPSTFQRHRAIPSSQAVSGKAEVRKASISTTAEYCETCPAKDVARAPLRPDGGRHSESKSPRNSASVRKSSLSSNRDELLAILSNRDHLEPTVVDHGTKDAEKLARYKENEKKWRF